MQIALNVSAVVCVGCGVCIDSCPTDVIDYDGETQKAVVAHLGDCQSCFLCVFDCPVDAITIRQQRFPLSEIGAAWKRLELAASEG
jgi:NAD-dependent dihydropyrimidine dehydrogenase PreA subunit